MRPKSTWLSSKTVKRVQRRRQEDYADDEWEDDSDFYEEIDTRSRSQRVRDQIKGRGERREGLFNSTIGDVLEDVWEDIDQGNFNPRGDDFLKQMGNIAAKGLALTVVVGVSTAASHAAKALMGKLIFTT